MTAELDRRVCERLRLYRVFLKKNWATSPTRSVDQIRLDVHRVSLLQWGHDKQGMVTNMSQRKDQIRPEIRPDV
jgi:hypothetical protein